MVLQGQDVATTLCDYISRIHILNMVVGASNRGPLARYHPSCSSHSDFCNVYSVSKGKVQKLKSSNDSVTPGSATSSTSQDSLPVFLDWQCLITVRRAGKVLPLIYPMPLTYIVMEAKMVRISIAQSLG